MKIDEATIKEIAEITYKTQTPITLLPMIEVKEGKPELIALGFSYSPKLRDKTAGNKEFSEMIEEETEQNVKHIESMIEKDDKR